MINKNLGVYFGKDKVVIVEVQGRHITGQAAVPLQGSGLKEETAQLEAVSNQKAQASAIRGVLVDNKIEAKSAFVGLSSKDLFIRSFQMLALGRMEIDSGVRFEAKKYLPTKTEDLIFDYQHRINKKLGKMDVLFIAATKSNLDVYFGLFSQLGIQVKVIEPAGFSLLRILSVTKQLDPKQSFAVVALQNLDLEFSIVIEGFPCFSRDIKLPLALPAGGSPSNPESVLQERIASEIRVSLDYFRRQFSGLSVDKIIFVAKNINLDLLSDLNKNLGLDVQPVNLGDDKELDALADLDTLKAYALAIRDAVKINLSVDLSKKKYIQITAEEVKAPEKPFVFDLGMLKVPLIVAAVFAALAYIGPLYELMKFKSNLKKARIKAEEALGPKFSILSLDRLQQRKAEYEEKLAAIKSLINSRSYFTPSCNSLPKAVREGLWIDEFDISSNDNSRALIIRGAAYFGDENSEAKAVEVFLEDLKDSQDFMRGLKKLELTSTGRSEEGGRSFTIFEISGS